MRDCWLDAPLPLCVRQDIATHHQREIGESGLPTLLRILKAAEQRDADVTEGILRIVADVVTVLEDDGVARVGVRNSELLLSDHRNVEILLDLLQGAQQRRR